MSLHRTQSIPRSERGAAMLAALCLAMVFAICLSSYIALCYTSLRMSTRNMMSSHSIELAEAGLEQALYAQNNNDWNPAFWTTAGGNATGTLTGFMFENGATGTVVLTVNQYGTNSPAFTSEAFVTLPDGTVLKRELQTTGSVSSTFVNALGATQGPVTFQAGGTVDSYDSSLGTYLSQTPGFSAVVLSESPPGYPGVRLNNADVSGYVIGESSSPVSYSSGAEIIGPNTPTAEKIDPTRILTQSQPNQPQYLENLPASATPITVNLSGTQTMTLGSPTATIPTPYYTVGDTILSNSSVLSIKGPVILLVNGNLNISGSAQIMIATTSPTSGGGPYVSLEMHVATGNMSIDGGGIVNNTLSPERLLVIGTGNASGVLEMGTASPFYGVMDFPNNSLTVSSNQQIYGSLVAGSITFAGSPSLHYDVQMQSATALVSGPPSFPGPLFNAFRASSQGTNGTLPVTIGSVVEVTPL